MKLKKVRIKNFRSIRDATVDFEPACRVLVGINESGKSNILRALSLLDKDAKPTKKDLRESLPDERDEEAHVEFVFEFNKEEIHTLYQNVRAKFLSGNETTQFAKVANENLTLKQFCQVVSIGIYNIDLRSGEKSGQYYSFEKEYSFFPQWKVPTEECPDDYTATVNSKTETIAEYPIIDTSTVSVNSSYVKDATIEDIETAIGEEISALVEKNLPETLLWTYDDENLLPSEIPLADFKKDPEMCKPLEHMFILAGYPKISEIIQEKMLASKHSMANLLDKVAKNATEHFHNIWKEYADVSFTLRPDGGNIIAGVKEKFNSYGFDQRSDGFKRFITFLLLVSTKVKNGHLRNTLILLDEAEIGLHPSGCRYFAQELIKISQENYVVFSTHSIFMIDREKLNRHILVKKTDEITTIETANQSNIFDEELLHNALGSSVFETLKKKNIVFEGFRDQLLYKLAVEHLPEEHTALAKKFKNIGICHAQGVKTITHVAALLQLANRECIIVTDCDKPALEHQKEYGVQKGYGEWVTYTDLLPSTIKKTGEDFVVIAEFMQHVNSSMAEIQIKHPQIQPITEVQFNTAIGRMKVFEEWLKTGNLKQEEIKACTAILKDKIFDTITPQSIDPEYYLLLTEITKKIE